MPGWPKFPMGTKHSCGEKGLEFFEGEGGKKVRPIELCEIPLVEDAASRYGTGDVILGLPKSEMSRTKEWC